MQHKLTVFIGILAICSLFLAPASTAQAQRFMLNPGGVAFNTFLGEGGEEYPNAIARDSSGNIYITGYSDSSWGSPIDPFGGYVDAHVAKFNSSGNLLWMTFLGGSQYDESFDIAVDSSGNVYVVGVSEASWGTPLNPFSSSFDAFIVKLNSNGVRQWNTFTGGASEADGIVLDASGNLYISGYSNFSWGSPINPITASVDAFAAKYNSSGALQWNTFFGGMGFESGWNMTADPAGNLYVMGNSSSTWGSPVNPHAGGGSDAFVAKFNSSGARQWHTFFGGTGSDFGSIIVADAVGNTYVTGSSSLPWGAPRRAFAGPDDIYAVKLNSSGARVWNTFLGGTDDDWGNSIALDGMGNLYVTGGNRASWGSPVNAFAGDADAMLAQLDNNGTLQWHTYLGGEGFDFGSDLVLDANGDIYLAGGSSMSWGSPLNPFVDLLDNFLAKLSLAGVSVDIGDTNRGNYRLLLSSSTRASFAGLDSGPVKLESTNAIPMIGAERVIYKVNGVNTSFTEMMGLPDSQLDTTYWLPWYNNVDLDTQLRIANVSGSPANVTITIGGQELDGGAFTLQPGQSTRKSFAGVNRGPVQIVSDVPIVAAERVIYKFNNLNTSFSEMMALPASQLDKVYWLPWYNNVELDTQLRFANVSEQPASVQVFIGGDEMDGSPFTLQPGQSTRKSFVGVNAGPVQIVSDQDIVAAERVIYKVGGKNTSFTEMMALPNKQLDTTYWLPWYNNKELDTQLRFANTSDQTASVHVYIGGMEMDGSPFTLQPGQSTRKSFPGVNRGPVQIVSDVPIVAAERLIYKVNGVPTSFSEMMALPNSQLDTLYWLPWYNNVDLDTQLRFGVP